MLLNAKSGKRRTLKNASKVGLTGSHGGRFIPARFPQVWETSFGPAPSALAPRRAWPVLAALGVLELRVHTLLAPAGLRHVVWLFGGGKTGKASKEPVSIQDVAHLSDDFHVSEPG